MPQKYILTDCEGAIDVIWGLETPFQMTFPGKPTQTCDSRTVATADVELFFEDVEMERSKREREARERGEAVFDLPVAEVTIFGKPKTIVEAMKDPAYVAFFAAK